MQPDVSLVFGVGAACAYLLKLVQLSKRFPWISAETKRINFYAQLVLSFLSTVGIGFQYDSAAHTLLISGLSLAAIFHAAGSWFVQFAVQHGFSNVIQMSSNGAPPAQEKKP
jgi:hypothetical protein